MKVTRLKKAKRAVQGVYGLEIVDQMLLRELSYISVPSGNYPKSKSVGTNSAVVYSSES